VRTIATTVLSSGNSATDAGGDGLLERLRSTTELLTSIAEDRRVLAGVPVEDRRRFLEAVSLVYSPDRAERRRRAKIAARERKAARVEQDERVLAESGIRTLRRPVVQTPNVFPPEGFEPRDLDAEPEQKAAAREARELQPCYVCKQKYSAIHHFYDQLCPPCAELNLAKRMEK